MVSHLVDDTPYLRAASYGCSRRLSNSCSNDAASDMTINYMDYEYMFMFKQGQKVRTQSIFSAGSARVNILTSNGVIAP
jgi:hypothetical protein